MAVTFTDDVLFQKSVLILGTNPTIKRSDLLQENLAKYAIPWTAWRVFDAFHTNLPGTPLTDDLGLVGGTWATNPPSLQTEDHQNNVPVVDNFARCMMALPPEYVTGETVKLRFHAGMKTTVADVSATLDVVAFESDLEDGLSLDLVTTAATTINSLTAADIDFDLTSSALVAGDILDIRIQTAIRDNTATGAVIGFIGGAWLLCDIKG